MWDFSYGRAIGLVLRTWPFLLLRFGAVMLVMTVFFGMIGACGLLGYAGANAYAEAFRFAGASFGGLLGAWLGGQLAGIVNEYVLYLVKAGHIAVMVETLEGRDIPAGAQIGHGRAIVTERFLEANVLFGLDQLIKLILSAFMKITEGMARATMIPGAKLVASFIDEIAKVSLGYVDEIILAHNIRTRQSNPWQGGVDALILYFQNGKTMLRNASWLTLFLCMTTGAIILAVTLPFQLGLVPAEGPAASFATVGGFAAFLVLAMTILEPLAVAALLEIYFKVTAGQTPNRKWEGEILKVAPAFMQLKEKAAEWRGGGEAPFPGGRTA